MTEQVGSVLGFAANGAPSSARHRYLGQTAVIDGLNIHTLIFIEILISKGYAEVFCCEVRCDSGCLGVAIHNEA